MAQLEPMDVDSITSDFDNKENSIQNSNVLPKTPSTEKGYEELDVSELNMKLQYSITPANSPMSQSYTVNYKGDSATNSLNDTMAFDHNLTRSLNATVTKSDILKPSKLPLQPLPTSLYTNSDDRRSCEREGNITVTISRTDDDNLSLPSTSSSAVQTPEATTPTKEIPKSDGSPIMRGLKSVLNMFRSSHSPVPPADDVLNHEDLTIDGDINYLIKNSPPHKESTLKDNSFLKESSDIIPSQENPCSENTTKETTQDSMNPQLASSIPLEHETTPKKNKAFSLLTSTPISNNKVKDLKDSSKRNSPLKESIVFNEGLEKELQWQETEIFFKNEKIPTQQLLCQTGTLNNVSNSKLYVPITDMCKLNTTVEHMDISHADVSYKSVIEDDTLNNIDTKAVNTEMSGVEFDEFLDCETTYTQNKSYKLVTAVENKISQVVIQTNNIPCESCLIDDNQAIYQCNDCDNDKIVIVENKTTELIADEVLDNFHNLPGALEFAIPSIESVEQTTDITNKILAKPVELSRTPSDFGIENRIDHEDDQINANNSVTCTSMSCSTIKFEEVNKTERPISTNQLCIQKFVEGSQKLIQPPNLDLETCVDATYESKDLNNPDITAYTLNAPASVLMVKTDDTINFDTDDNNTTRILFKIDELLGNKVKSDNLEREIIFNTKNTATEYNKASDILNVLNSKTATESIEINDNIDKHEKIHKDISNLKVVDKILECFEELNENTCVPNENIDEYCTINSTITKNNNVEICKHDLQNIEVDITSESIKTNPVELNQNKNISIMECDVNNIDIQNGESMSLIISNHHISYIKNIEGSHGTIMDSLDPNLLNDELTCEINKSDMHSDVDNSNEQNYIPIEFKHNMRIDLPLPLDVALPSDDDLEKDSLLYHSPNQNTNEDRIISELETKKATGETKIDSNETNLLETLEPQNDQTLDIPHKNRHNSLNCMLDIDTEMVIVESNNNQDIHEQSPTNRTSCLQDFYLETKKEAQQESIVDTDEKEIAAKVSCKMLPINNPEIDCLSTQINNTDITNETTICAKNSLEVKSFDNTIKECINSNKVDINLTSIETVDESDNPDLELEALESLQSSQIYGYNINFDEIENPFATKTNIRMSPPPRTPNKTFTPVNNNQINIHKTRNSQKEENRHDVNKKRLNTSINKVKITNSSNSKNCSNNTDAVHTVENINKCNKNVYNDNTIADILLEKVSLAANSDIEFTHTSNILKTSPDFKILTVLNESSEKNSPKLDLKCDKESRSVFNIPELDDVNFNPFATKSRICVTPPLADLKEPLNVINSIVTDPTNGIECKIEQSDATVCIDNNENVACMNDCVQNDTKTVSNISNENLSVNTEDATVSEVNTEDEDTIEGPFFEAEDLNEVVNVPEIKIENDVMQFKDGSAALNNEDANKGELFIDAEAYEFLLNQNISNAIVDSGKESLFLKFDPLFAKRVSSDGVLAALSLMQKKQSTPKKLTRTPLVTLEREETPMVNIAGPSNVMSMPEIINNEDIISTVSKPMMVVNPAIAKQPIAMPRISLTPKTNRQSLNFASPAMLVIDNLLSLSNKTSLLDQDVPTDSSRQYEANIVLVQLRELLAEKELHVHSLKCESKELRERLFSLESQVISLKNEGEERLKKVNMLNEQLSEKTKINKSIAIVVEEYERTIAVLISEMEQEKKLNAEERMRLIKERDEQTAHLASMEASYSDLHSKYEKSKQVIFVMKANEDSYKKSIKESFEANLNMRKNYDQLKQHATSKLNHANQELEKINRAHDAEVLKLNAILKRKELHITSLEESIAQKSKANEELTAICDELINKVG